jgi:hypothetical protein
MGLPPLAFGRLESVAASQSRLVVGSQRLAMSRSCASMTPLTLAASAYVILVFFGLTAKQPLLSTLLAQIMARFLESDVAATKADLPV